LSSLSFLVCVINAISDVCFLTILPSLLSLVRPFHPFVISTISSLQFLASLSFLQSLVRPFYPFVITASSCLSSLCYFCCL
jgi:hypothetical protein